ncbi:MAG: hypothetical protein HYZ16_05140 [Bacteroidetes bacterium]|jgi:methylmalonyl-CoA mutase|nr:hypothetical protein [Bacteroidota bacterium]
MPRFEPLSLHDWALLAEQPLKGKPLSSLDWQSFEGIAVPPYHTRQLQHQQAWAHVQPGMPPYLRSQKTQGNGWMLRECIKGRKNLQAAHARALAAIEGGVQHLVLEINPQRDGFDGLPIHRLDQLDSVIQGIDPQAVGIGFNAQVQSPFYYKLLLDWAIQQGVASRQLFGSLDFDPLSHLLGQGEMALGIPAGMAHLADILRLAAEHTPYYKVLTLHSSTFHTCGASAVDELAFTLSLAQEYLHGLQQEGIPLYKAVGHLQTELSIGSSYFMEIAKVRAWRWLWASLLQAYDLAPELQGCHVVARTSTWNKGVYDPHVNLLRLTTESLAAAIGTADEIQIDPYDQAFRPSAYPSRRLSRNIHHLLAHEANIDKTTDPAAGSYYIEFLTHSLAQEAWRVFQETEQRGGLLAVAGAGWLQNRLKTTRKQRENRLATRKEKFIGVNEYPNPKDRALDLVKESPGPTPYETVDMPAVKRLVDMVHLSQHLGWSHGHTAANCEALPQYVATEAFEQLRVGVEIAQEEGQAIPSFFVLALGDKATRTARANYALNFYACAGFKVVLGQGNDSVEDGIKEFMAQPCKAVVICAADKEYPSLVPAVAKSLQKKGLYPKLILAGNPGQLEETYRDMGIEEFIYNGCHVYGILQAYVPTTTLNN